MSAYELNRLMYDLREPANRESYTEDLERHMQGYDLDDHEKRLVRDQDWHGLVEAGTSIYVLTKTGATVGVSLYEMGAQMRGESPDEFWAFIGEQNERNASRAILPDRH